MSQLFRCVSQLNQARIIVAGYVQAFGKGVCQGINGSGALSLEVDNALVHSDLFAYSSLGTQYLKTIGYSGHLYILQVG